MVEPTVRLERQEGKSYNRLLGEALAEAETQLAKGVAIGHFIVIYSQHSEDAVVGSAQISVPMEYRKTVAERVRMYADVLERSVKR